MAAMAKKVQHGRALTCANASHMAMYDDSACYFPRADTIPQDVDARRF